MGPSFASALYSPSFSPSSIGPTLAIAPRSPTSLPMKLISLSGLTAGFGDIIFSPSHKIVDRDRRKQDDREIENVLMNHFRDLFPVFAEEVAEREKRAHP